MMLKPDPLKTVEWRDLVALTPMEKAWELTLGLPWLVLSLWCYEHGWWPPGLARSFYLFLANYSIRVIRVFPKLDLR